MLKQGSVCSGCMENWLNQDKEPLVLHALPNHTTNLDIEVFYCTHCDSGGNGEGIYEIVKRSKSS